MLRVKNLGKTDIFSTCKAHWCLKNSYNCNVLEYLLIPLIYQFCLKALCPVLIGIILKCPLCSCLGGERKQLALMWLGLICVYLQIQSVAHALDPSLSNMTGWAFYDIDLEDYRGDCAAYWGPRKKFGGKKAAAYYRLKMAAALAKADLRDKGSSPDSTNFTNDPQYALILWHSMNCWIHLRQGPINACFGKQVFHNGTYKTMPKEMFLWSKRKCTYVLCNVDKWVRISTRNGLCLSRRTQQRE